MTKLEDKLALVAWCVRNWEHPIVDPAIDLIDSIYETVFKSQDKLWATETDAHTFLRYHELGHITDDQVEELWMRAVLAGLHNKAEEYDA